MGDVSIYFLQFEATPRRDSPYDGDADGAFVNCWVQAGTPDEAEALAAEGIRSKGWIVGAADEAHPVERTDYRAAQGKGLAYFEQALRERMVVIFYAYVMDEDRARG